MKDTTTSPYIYLKDREIVDILIGDTIVAQIESDEKTEKLIKMPYLSGADLASLSLKFGLPVNYEWGNALSRWKYFSNLLDHCTQEDSCPNLLKYLLTKERFEKTLSVLPIKNIANAYDQVIINVLQKINNILYFSNHELIKVNDRFLVQPLNIRLELETPKIKQINQEYIKKISNETIQEVNEEKFDSAITKSRTLLEEVFIYGIEAKGEEPNKSGQINRLFKQIKDLYNMHIDRDTDVRIKKLLSGLESIVTGISEMRNNHSDSHGIGSDRINIKKYHATLLVNTSMTMSEFVLSVIQENLNHNNKGG